MCNIRKYSLPLSAAGLVFTRHGASETACRVAPRRAIEGDGVVVDFEGSQGLSNCSSFSKDEFMSVLLVVPHVCVRD